MLLSQVRNDDDAFRGWSLPKKLRAYAFSVEAAGLQELQGVHGSGRGQTDM